MNLIETKDFLCQKGYGFATIVVNADDPTTDIIEVYIDDFLLEECDSFKEAVEMAWEHYIK